jgi:uncharacterized C2H2 Zn-finger protein
VTSYTSILYQKQLWSDKTFEQQLKDICVCHLAQYSCQQEGHDNDKGSDQLGLPYPCPYRMDKQCFITFETSNYAWKHARKAHPESSVEKTIRCSYCPSMFEKKHHLERHLQKTHQNGKGKDKGRVIDSDDEGCGSEQDNLEVDPFSAFQLSVKASKSRYALNIYFHPNFII